MTKIKELKREIEVVSKALFGDPATIEEAQRLKELLELLREYEECYKQYEQYVSHMTETDKEAEAKQINKYFDSVILEPMMEPYRDALRNASLMSLNSEYQRTHVNGEKEVFS